MQKKNKYIYKTDSLFPRYSKSIKKKLKLDSHC